MSRDELEQNIIELTTQVESQKQKIQWLQEQFNLLQQKRFGASSEKDMADGDQMSLFNEVEWTVDEAEGEIPEPDMAKVAPPKKKKTKGGKLRMVSGLPKETIDFRLSEEEQICPECGENLTEVRKTIRRELIVIPAQVKAKEYIDAVYACRNCQKNGTENPMHTGRAPRPLLENSLASASFVSDIMKKKFVDGVPVYRPETDLKRKGIRLTRQTMSGWVIRCSEKYLQTDGYAGYNSVTKREKDPAVSVRCWAHARRFFCDASKAIKKGNSEVSATNIDKAIAYADRIFAIERDNDLAKKTPQERMQIRKEKTLPILDEYFKWIRSFDPDHIIKGKFRDGIVYSQNQEDALRAFLLDGRLSCSNNAAERSIKPFVISRKNFLFCKTPSGAKATATVFSLIETAKANKLDPFKYLVYIFEKLSQDEDYDLEQLMPWTESVVSACKAAACE